MDAYVVNRPFRDSNVGSNLSSLAGAHSLARRLGRGLVVDWRGMSQLTDASLNYFTEFFVSPTEMLGVPVLYAPTELGYEGNGADVRYLTPGEARQLGTREEDAAERYLVLEAYHGLDRVHPGPTAEQAAMLRRLYRAIRPAPRIEETVDDWVASEFDAPFVVGVNVRTGNGRYFQPGMHYSDRVDTSLFENHQRFLHMLERACRRRLARLPRPMRENFQIFFATDSAAMSGVLAQLPNSMTRRRIFPPPGTGDTSAFERPEYDDHASVDDTLADMFLLARCDALVYNTSLFNQYARVVTGQFSGNLVHFESLILKKRAAIKIQAVGRRLDPRRAVDVSRLPAR